MSPDYPQAREGGGFEADEILAEQVRMLYANSKLTLALHPLIIGITLPLLWQTAPRSLVFGWIAALAVAIFVRARLMVAYNRASTITNDASQWAWRFAGTVLLNGCIWGGAGAYLATTGDQLSQSAAAFLLTALSAGALTTLAPVSPVYLAFLLPSLVPITLVYLLRQEPRYLIVGVLISILTISLIFVSRYQGRILKATIQKGFEHTAALRKLRIANQRLQQSELRFQDIATSSGDWIWELDRDYRYIFVSGRIKEMLGYHTQEILGLTPFMLMPASDAAHLRMAFVNCRAGRQPRIELEHAIRATNGSEHRVAIQALAIFDENGKYNGFRGTASDITERAEAEQAQRLAAVAFEGREAILITDGNLSIQRINPAFTELTGYAEEEVIDRTPCLLRSDHHSPAFYQNMWGILDAEGRWEGEVHNRLKDGSVHPHWVAMTVVRNNEGETSHYVLHYLDLVERQQAAEHLQRSRETTQRLLRDLEQERQTLAWALQDTLGQRLVGIDLRAASIARRVDGNDAKLQVLTGEVMQQLGQAQDAAQAAVAHLRPAELDSQGLTAALRLLVTRWERAHGVSCTFATNKVSNLLDDLVQITIYRVLEDFLADITSHPEVARVHIRLTSETRGPTESRGQLQDVLCLHLQDDLQVTDEASDSAEITLMHERIAAAGGTFAQWNLPNGGRQFEATLPQLHADTNAVSRIALSPDAASA